MRGRSAHDGAGVRQDPDTGAGSGQRTTIRTAPARDPDSAPRRLLVRSPECGAGRWRCGAPVAPLSGRRTTARTSHHEADAAARDRDSAPVRVVVRSPACGAGPGAADVAPRSGRRGPGSGLGATSAPGAESGIRVRGTSDCCLQALRVRGRGRAQDARGYAREACRVEYVGRLETPQHAAGAFLFVSGAGITTIRRDTAIAVHPSRM